MICKCCQQITKQFKTNGIYKCPSCNHIYRDYSYVNLFEYYQKYRETYKIFPINDWRNMITNNLVNYIKNYINKDDKLLEIGSGDGFLSENLKKYCNNITCCELDNNLSLLLEKKGFNVLNDNFMNLDKSFDIVVLIDVLEHFNELLPVENKLNEICDDKLIIQVPIKRKLHFRKDFDGHFHYFSLESITKLFEKHFKLIFHRETEKKETANGRELIVVFQKIK